MVEVRGETGRGVGREGKREIGGKGPTSGRLKAREVLGLVELRPVLGLLKLT